MSLRIAVLPKLISSANNSWGAVFHTRQQDSLSRRKEPMGSSAMRILVASKIASVIVGNTKALDPLRKPTPVGIMLIDEFMAPRGIRQNSSTPVSERHCSWWWSSAILPSCKSTVPTVQDVLFTSPVNNLFGHFHHSTGMEQKIFRIGENFFLRLNNE